MAPILKRSCALAVVAVVYAAAVCASPSRPNPPEHKQPITTRALLSLKDIGGAEGSIAVSPDGRYVAFEIQQADFRADTYHSEWYVTRVAGRAAPLEVGSGGDLILAPAPFGRINGSRADIRAQWSPDGRWIAFLRKDGDQVQVWRSRADGGGEQQVTHAAANVLSFAWRPDGRAIYFEVGRSRREMARRDREEGERGYLLDDRFFPVYSTKPLWFACGARIWNVPVVSSERCAPRLWVAPFGSAERKATPAEVHAFERLVAPVRPPGVATERSIRDVTWNGARTRVAWLENLSPQSKPGFAAPVTLFVANRRCRAPQCTGRLEDVWWYRSGVVFLRHEGWDYSVPAIYVWSPGRGQPRRVYREDSTLRSCSMAGDRLVCLQETPTTPRKIISIDLANGRVRTVYDPNPGFSRYRLGRVEKLEVTDGLGNEAFGHLVYPPDFRAGRRYPLIIVQYRSSGFLRGGTGNEYPIFPLAAAGFLVYSSDKPEDEQLLEDYDTSHWRSLAAQVARQVGPSGYELRSALGALESVIGELERRGIIDGTKVGITGLSTGAVIVVYALTHSKQFAAAAVSGLQPPITYPLVMNRTARALLKAEWGAQSIEDAIRTGRKIDSLYYDAQKVDAPLLIQVSDHELIPALPAVVALREAGKPVEAYVFPDEYHIKWQPLHKLYVGERAIDWFRFWLEDQEDPAPAKAAQYVRWRKLRAQMAERARRAR